MMSKESVFLFLVLGKSDCSHRKKKISVCLPFQFSGDNEVKPVASAGKVNIHYSPKFNKMQFKNFLLAIMVIVLSGAVIAQPYENKYQVPNSTVEFSSFHKNTQVLSSTEILTVGAVLLDNATKWSIFAMKSHPSGNFHWYRLYSDIGLVDIDLKGVTFDVTNNTALIVGSHANDNLTAIKIDLSNGAIIWSKLLYLGLNTQVAEVQSVQIQGIDGHIIAGTTELLGGLKKPFIMTLDDAAGNIIWSNIYEELTNNNEDISLSLTDLQIDGAKIIGIGHFDGRLASFDVSLVLGNPVSSELKTWGPSTGLGLAGKVDVTERVGNTGDYYYANLVDPLDATKQTAFYVNKIGAGNWAKTYTLAGASYYDALELYRTTSGGTDRVFFFGRTGQSTQGFDFHLLELNPANGAIIGQHQFHTKGIGGSMALDPVNKRLFWTAFSQLQMGEFFLSITDNDGKTGCETPIAFVEAVEEDYSEVFVDMDYDSFGVEQIMDVLASNRTINYLGDCNAAKTRSMPSAEDQTASSVNIFPNPINDETATVRLEFVEIEGKVRVMIYDATGRKTYDAQETIDPSTGLLQLDASVFGHGINLIQITGSDFSTTKRIVRN